MEGKYNRGGSLKHAYQSLASTIGRTYIHLLLYYCLGCFSIVVSQSNLIRSVDAMRSRLEFKALESYLCSLYYHFKCQWIGVPCDCLCCQSPFKVKSWLQISCLEYCIYAAKNKHHFASLFLGRVGWLDNH